MSDSWILGATAAQDAYRPADDPWTATNPYPEGSEAWQFYQDQLAAGRPKPAPTSVWDATKNVGRGIAGLGSWFLEQARKPEAEAQADVRRVAGGVADIIPKAFEASEQRRQGGEYRPGPVLNAAMLGTSGGLLGGTGGEAGTVLTAGMRRARRLPPPPAAALEANPRAVIGGNMPPEAIELEAPAAPKMGSVVAPPPVTEPPVTTPPPSWTQGLPRAQPARTATEVPDIRGLPVDEAVDIARKQPHLVRAGDQSEGYYVGGPRDIQSKAALNKQRREVDAYIAADPRGGRWYDQYRGGLNEITGGDPLRNLWYANQEGQWSAGVDPASEAHFAIKERNAAIAGMPVKAARPAQHEAHMAALAAKDPSLYQLGDKTGEYAIKTNPDQALPPGATGVNDFRYARTWGYTEPGGAPQKNALTTAGHRFMDMETALAVDRANRMNLGGRSDWTGEQIQAAPWVRQKALDLMSRNPNLTYEEAFARANTTIADALPRHTAFATFEQQPGSTTGHLPASTAADQAAREAYAADPGSSWGSAPGGRDAIYYGLGVEGTGNYMGVRPSQPMQGYYTTPEGVIETNPGEVARPIVTFNTPTAEGEAFKKITPADQAILNAGEAVRGYIDAQNASAWHKNWTGGPLNQSNSLFFPRAGKVTPAELAAIQAKASQYGLGDVVDTGSGITSTSFYPGLNEVQNKALTSAVRKGEFKDFGETVRARTDSGYIDYTEKWPEGVGSGAATRHMLEYLNKTPELRDAFNRNGYIGERAAAKLARDDAWAAKWGAPREDIQNARKIIASGPGWVDRLEAALKAGAILPAVAAAIYAAAAADRPAAEDRS
jgi:hypothetical protein